MTQTKIDDVAALAKLVDRYRDVVGELKEMLEAIDYYAGVGLEKRPPDGDDDQLKRIKSKTTAALAAIRWIDEVADPERQAALEAADQKMLAGAVKLFPPGPWRDAAAETVAKIEKAGPKLVAD